MDVEFLRQNAKPPLWGPLGWLKLVVLMILLMVTFGEVPI